MTFPTPPADNSGGYFIGQYSNGIDLHRFRLHVRPFDATGTYTAPTAVGETTVMATFTAYVSKIKTNWNASWVFSLVSIFQRNSSFNFTEIFGYTAPATITGTDATATTNDQQRALQTTWTMRDSFGGKLRLVWIGVGNDTTPLLVPVTVGGNPAGTVNQILVDYLSTATKTNIVSHNGHVVQSPARVTFAINRRLRRHYGFA